MIGLLHRKECKIFTHTGLQDRADARVGGGKIYHRLGEDIQSKRKSTLFKDSRDEQQETALPMDGTTYGQKGY